MFKTEIKETKNNLKFNHFVKTLTNGRKVYNFDAIKNNKFGINILMSERGAIGKTLNCKLFLIKESLKNNKKSVWFYNTGVFLLKEKEKFLDDLQKPFVLKENPELKEIIPYLSIIGSKTTNEYQLVYNKDNKPKTILYLTSLSAAESNKGARRKINYYIWEEFNVDFSRVRNATKKVITLLLNFYDPVERADFDTQLFVFGNNKSMDNPFLHKQKIYSITKEVSTFAMQTINDNKEIVNEFKNYLQIIAPKYSMQEIDDIEQDYKNNWIFQLSKNLGNESHNFYNLSLFDTNQNIEFVEEVLYIKHLKHFAYILVDKQWLLFSTNGKYLYLHETTNLTIQNIPKITTKSKFINEHIVFNPDFRVRLIRANQKQILKFTTITARNLFYKCIT